ncbi:DNA utilization protein GntX [Halomonas lysinitropha]|uniref:DNA utilization protein GntX n=3 Tax=Halomonas lysinitropha TaxID=2607506 RepID=A0A5K1IA98_9GAMM|nr:DNA utilization protein GntX [Halomonas lysinitropha]
MGSLMVNLIFKSRLTNSLKLAAAMSTAWKSQVDGWLSRALPGRCVFCLASLPSDHPWCEACFTELPWNLPACPVCAEPQPGAATGRRCGHCLRRPPRFDRARVPLRYDAEVAGLVQRFKFDASPRAGRVLLELLLAGLSSADRHWPQALVPVPLHPRRARERGFDQARWLAVRLKGQLGCPLMPAQRIRDTRTQRGLDRGERRSNLLRAFRVPEGLPRRVVLVDDVMTTGATLDALAKACRQAGAEEVQAWAVARTPAGRH